MEKSIVHLNVGGVDYSTARSVLVKCQSSKLYEWFKEECGVCPIAKDSNGRYFLDRDGSLFRFILDYLRSGYVILPENFSERARLQTEARYFGLSEMESQIGSSRLPNGFITVGYQGTFSFGRQGLAGADINFRKISRILVCGKVSLCREVFGETLNEGRDPDRGQDDRYSARFFLKHNFLEQAFDALKAAGFHLAASCASGTSGSPNEPGTKHVGASTEEDRWAHYNEFIFSRP